MGRNHLRSLAPAVAVALGVLGAGSTARAQSCRLVTYYYQPVPYPQNVDPKGALEEKGPQVAIWVETPQGQFVDTVFVTNKVGKLGIGNRPGVWNFPSSPRFPYGKRRYALPVWAISRGKQYAELVFQQSQPETTFGFHELISTAEREFCRPMQPSEIVDAVSCPSPRFTSAKGEPDPTGAKSYYPPRNDVYDAINDLDAVTGATPDPTAANPPGIWMVPSTIPDGQYVMKIEVNKQYDTNSSYAVTTQIDSMGLTTYGIPNKIGQPSIVWSVPVRLDGTTDTGAVVEPDGYGPVDGQPRNPLVTPIDSTISDQPGSGKGRLGVQQGPSGPYKWRVDAAGCQACAAFPAPDDIIGLGLVGKPESQKAQVAFQQTAVMMNGADLQPLGYKVKYMLGTAMTQEQFDGSALDAPAPMPGPRSSTVAPIELSPLQPDEDYVACVQAMGPCNKRSNLACVTFHTPAIAFKTIEGCFIATAAFGSKLQPDVATLRRFRDRLLLPTGLGRALVTMYYASSPPIARLVAHSAMLRALVRGVLEPEIDVARGALLLLEGLRR